MVDALSDLLVETVASGGSVGFMHTLSRSAARNFWTMSLASARRGECVVLGALDGDDLAATITLLLTQTENEPHRAEIAKLMTRVPHRGRGIGTALLQAAERVAASHGRSLLVLDTASDDGARFLYRRAGYTYVGTIADYALKPLGGLTATEIYCSAFRPTILTKSEWRYNRFFVIPRDRLTITPNLVKAKG